MHPILLHLDAFSLGSLSFGPWDVHAYAVLVGLGMLLGAIVAVRYAPKMDIDPGDALDTFLFVALGGILGGRLLHLLVHAGHYWDACFHPTRSNPLFQDAAPGQAQCFAWLGLSGGTIWYGGVLGAMLAGLAVARYKKISFWNLTDLAFPSVALGHVFGRLGCFFAGCCYGKPSSSFWGVAFPGGSLASAMHNSQGWIEGLHAHSLPVVPTQLLEAVFNLGLAIFLLFLRGKRRFVGQITALYFLIYATGRGLLEFLRGDVERGFLLSWTREVTIEGNTLLLPDGLSTSQVLSLLLILVLGFWYWKKTRQTAPTKKPPSQRQRQRG